MLQTQFNAQAVFLIDNPWDGNSAFETEWSLIRDTQTGLTQRESRRPYSATLRATAKYDCIVHDDALRMLQGSLRSLNTQPVILPLWAVMVPWAERGTAPISGGLKIVWKEDWSRFEIFQDAEPAWPADDDFVAPALWGFISPTRPQLRNPDSALWSVDFTESSPAQYAIAPAAFEFPAGPQPPCYPFTPPLLPFRPDFSAVSEEISVEVKRDSTGFGREQNQTFYPHAASRSQTASYTIAGENGAAQLLRFFQDVAAPGSAFWAPGWFQLASLTQDAEPADTVLQVSDTSAVNVGDYVAIVSFDTAIARRIVATNPGTITLDAAPDIPIIARTTLVQPLCLARLDKPTLKVSWTSPAAAKCQLEWTELPAEYVPPPDETIGITLGRLPQKVVLFEFARDFANGTTAIDRFTSYETDLQWNGNLYRSSQLGHGDIKQSLNFDDSGVDLDSFIFADNPLALDATLKSETPLSLTLRHADFDGQILSNVQVVFTGELDSFNRKGASLRPTFKAGPATLDDQFPRMLRGLICNHLSGANPDGSFLVSYGCGLAKANWKFTGIVAEPVSGAFPYVLNLANLARATGLVPAIFLDWFAYGWVELGAGAAIQRRLVIRSTAPVANTLSLTLHRWFETPPVAGQTVTLYPGCDGTAQSCRAYDAATNTLGKFNNYPNFGAEPMAPNGNPSLLKLSTAPVRGTKK
jgi:hypothetical protein